MSHGEILRAALSAHAEGRIDDAEIFYREALTRELDDAAIAAHRMGMIALQKGSYVSAEALIRQSLALRPMNADAHSNLGAVLRDQGKREEAIAAYQEALRLNPDDPEAWRNLGTTLAAESRHEEAIAAFRRAVTLRPSFAEAHFALGIALVNQKRFEEGIAAYRTVSALQPNAPETYYNLAIALTASGKSEEAVSAYRQAVAVKPDFPGAYLNLSVLLRQLGQVGEAIEVCQQALAVQPNFPEICFNLGGNLAAQGRFDEAIAVYQRAIALRPEFPEAFGGLGLVFASLRRLEEAAAAYRQAIALRPDFYETYLNLSVVLRDLGKAEEALEACRQVVALRPDNIDALINLGTMLREGWMLEEALDAYRRAAAIDPNAVKANAQLAILRRQLCDWSEFDLDTARLLERFNEVEPFVLFTAPSTPAQQLASARSWVSQFGPSVPAFAHAAPKPGARIRLGYLSADFHQHATAYLMAELFERHDRSRFEIFGYSYGRDDGSDIRKRLIGGFEHFVDLHTVSHGDAARRIHADAIDILVDLKGYTGNTRTEILVNRPAPVQVNYLGFPGTMGADFIDYIIADRFVAPMENQPYFSEKIVHLPHCYQCNDTKRLIAEQVPSRAECGLPEKGFVFCSFNGAYKITPMVFDIWMRLLKAVPGSVLWLLSTNSVTENNLRSAAAQRGVDPARLVFCPPLQLPYHLARHRNADLFLDTSPVNAHTTASDALWAGLPLVTCMGETFISRVAASLLHTIGLPELVTHALSDYETLALALATDRERLAAIRQKLLQQRLTSPLFDIDRFTRDIEAAYETMHVIRMAGGAPRAFVVPER